MNFLHLCVWYAHAMVHVWRSEDSLWEYVISFHHVVVRLGKAPLPAEPACWLSHPDGPGFALEKIVMARLLRQCSGLEFELWELDTCWLWTKEVMVNQKSLSFQFKISQSWGDGVVSKVLIAWTWGPEFWPRTHVKSKKQNNTDQTSKQTKAHQIWSIPVIPARGSIDQWTPGLCRLASLINTASSRWSQSCCL